MNYYHILSLDGGGIRGLLTCKLLERLERMYPGFLETVDLFAGTSTGGILALGLASGMKPAEIAEIYQKEGGKIFYQTIYDHIGDIDRLVRADYGNAPLQKALHEKFQERRLGELQKKVLITTFQMDSGSITKVGVRSWKAKFFENFGDDPSDCDQKVVDVALRTSAAPTFFPMYQGFVDGGVVANNPGMCAVAQALDRNSGGQRLSHITLLSVGTGVRPKWVEGFHEDWGYMKWAPNLVNIFMDGVSGVADYQCKQILGARYMRINVLFQEDVGMDALDKMPYMAELADKEELGATKKWFAKYYSLQGTPT